MDKMKFSSSASTLRPMVISVLLSLTVVLLVSVTFSNLSLSSTLGSEPEIVLDEATFSSAVGLMSDSNFTITVNSGESLSGGQMSDGHIIAHPGQSWMQVSWLTGVLSSISIPSISMWGLVVLALSLIFASFWKIQRKTL